MGVPEGYSDSEAENEVLRLMVELTDAINVRALPPMLAARDISLSKKQINRALYRLLKKHQVKRIGMAESKAPLWVLDGDANPKGDTSESLNTQTGLSRDLGLRFVKVVEGPLRQFVEREGHARVPTTHVEKYQGENRQK